jgi:hypothetical protein
MLLSLFAGQQRKVFQRQNWNFSFCVGPLRAKSQTLSLRIFVSIIPILAPVYLFLNFHYLLYYEEKIDLS